VTPFTRFRSQPSGNTGGQHDTLKTSVFQPFLHHGPLYAIKKFWGTPNKIL